MDGPEKKNSFAGVTLLEKAVEDGLLRPGQIIFGTVSLKHHEQLEGTRLGNLSDLFAPVILFLTKGQKRPFAYLHAALYVGEVEGVHYVVENGGMDPSTGKGNIAAIPIRDAFEADAHFVVV